MGEVMAIDEAIDQFLDGNGGNVAATLSKLVQLKSVNTGEPGTGDEFEVQDYLAKELTAMGLAVESAANDNPRRPNVVGKLSGLAKDAKNGKGRDMLFNAHADVVPPGDLSKWDTAPFSGIIKDGKVFGRGAVDCKSGLTAALWAIKAVQAAKIQLKGDVYYISSVGEESNEGGTVGAAAAIKDRSFYNDPFCIVAEGSSFEIYTVSGGLFYFSITIPGKPVHTGRRNLVMYPQNYGIPCGPEVGVDALEKALPFIQYFYRLEKEWAFRFRESILNSGGFPMADKTGVGLFTFCPVSIQGGMYLGSVMDSVTVKYCVWYPESAGRDKLIEEIKSAVAAMASTDHWLREHPPVLDIPVPQIWRGFKTDHDHPGVKLLQSCCEDVRREHALLSGHRASSDCTYVAEKGIPVVLFGASNSLNNVHGFNENASISEVIDAAKIYARMIVKWCG